MPVAVFPALAIVLGAAWAPAAAGRVAAVASLALAVCAALAWRRSAPRLLVAAVLLGLLAASAALGAEARARALHTSARALLDEAFGGYSIDTIGPGGAHDPLRSRVRLVEDAAAREGYVSLRGRLVAVFRGVAWHAVDGGVLVSVSGEVAGSRVLAWRAGRLLEAPITFRRPARYLNEGVDDAEVDLALGGVTLLGSVKSGLLVDVVEPAGAIGELAADLRAHVRRVSDRWIARHDSVSGAIATAVLIGDRAGLPDRTRDALQAAGTYHVIAISGGNIAILAAAVLSALVVVGLRGRCAAGVVVVSLLAYASIVTSGPSVWRATVMAALYFGARALDHRAGAWQTAAVAAALMLVTHPLDVADPGFLLTFGATIALLEGSRRWGRWAAARPVRMWLLTPVLASLTVEIALLPVTAWLFSRVTAAGLVLNIAAIPLMTVVQIATIVATVASPIEWLAAQAGQVAHLAAAGLVGSADLVSLVPWVSRSVPAPPAWLLAVYYASLALWVLAERRLLRVGAAVVLGAAALVVAGALPTLSPWPGPGRLLRLTAFDVGQGEAILLETPGGRRILVDAGGGSYGSAGDVGARVVLPALWARGIRALDALLLTHADPDHAGGAPDVLRALPVGRLWEGIRVEGHGPTLAVVEAASRRRVPVAALRAGDRIDAGAATVRVLHPGRPDWARPRVRNDDSVVIEVVYGDVALLLTGDISAEVERAVAPLLTPAPIRVLKVGHHGSRSSSGELLLESWRPQLALISCGRGNAFGHPAAEALARLSAVGAQVLRTDLQGQVQVDTDGRTLWYRTFSGDRGTLGSSP